jgi:hypothetical protein
MEGPTLSGTLTLPFSPSFSNVKTFFIASVASSFVTWPVPSPVLSFSEGSEALFSLLLLGKPAFSIPLLLSSFSGDLSLLVDGLTLSFFDISMGPEASTLSAALSLPTFPLATPLTFPLSRLETSSGFEGAGALF